MTYSQITLFEGSYIADDIIHVAKGKKRQKPIIKYIRKNLLPTHSKRSNAAIEGNVEDLYTMNRSQLTILTAMADQLKAIYHPYLLLVPTLSLLVLLLPLFLGVELWVPILVMNFHPYIIWGLMGIYFLLIVFFLIKTIIGIGKTFKNYPTVIYFNRLVSDIHRVKQ